MTTRAKRSAKSPRIEALVREDRELFKGLLKESLHEGPGSGDDGGRGRRVWRAHRRSGRVPVRLLQPGLGDADREARAAGAARPGGPLLDGTVRPVSTLGESAGERVGRNVCPKGYRRAR